MAIVLGATLLAGLISWFGLKNSEIRKGSTIAWVVVAAVISFVAVSVISTYYLNDNRVSYEKEVVSESNLIVLDNNQNIRGSFFIFAGYVDKVMRYQYYYETADGGFKYDTMKYWKATIYEEDREDAVLQKVKKIPRYEFEIRDYLWGVPWFVNSLKVNEFHVPEGTVVRGVSIDITE